MMSERERNINHVKRMIEKQNKDLAQLKRDLVIVSSDLSRKSIEQHIDSIKRFIERQEFKLWKLERETV